MATEVKVPALGRIDHRGDARGVAEAARRGRRARRADRQPGDRQGRGRGPLPRRGHDGRAARQGRRHDRGRRGHRRRSRPAKAARPKRSCPKPPRSIRPAPARISRPRRKEADEEDGPHLTLSPAVRRIVLEHHLDPSKIKGTGKDGRLTKDDVLAAAEAPKAEAPAQISPRRRPGPRPRKTRPRQPRPGPRPPPGNGRKSGCG